MAISEVGEIEIINFLTVTIVIIPIWHQNFVYMAYI